MPRLLSLSVFALKASMTKGIAELRGTLRGLIAVHPFGYLYENKVVRDHLAGDDHGDLVADVLGRSFASIPMVDETAEAIGAGFELSNVFVVACTHLLEDTAYLFSVLERHGLSPSDVAIVGKPYSTCMAIALEMKRRGYFIHPASHDMDVGEPLARSRERANRAVLQRAQAWCAATSGGRVVILDSGGHLIRMAHDPEFAMLIPRTTATEVTSQGIFQLEDFTLAFPVVNVARCWAKLTYESGDIGLAVTSSLGKHVSAVGASVQRALVVGYGSVGRAVARALTSDGIVVTVVDPAISAADVDGSHTYEPDRAKAFAEADTIVGCAGRSILSMADWPLLADGVVLASASSSDIEMRAWELRRHYRHDALKIETDPFGFDYALGGASKPAFLGTRTDPSHYTYTVELDGGRRVRLLNGGCPINFTGGPLAMPHKASRLTVSLALCGIRQASETAGGPGLEQLRMDWQKRVTELHLRSEVVLSVA